MSNPGRQSLMLLNPPIQKDTNAKAKLHRGPCWTSSLPQGMSVRSRRASASPTHTKQKWEFSMRSVTPTISPNLLRKTSNLSVENSDLVIDKCKKEISNCSDFKTHQKDLIYYFKSSYNSKMSDYEDIWDTTQNPETYGCPGLSPMQSEKKFKEFLFKKFLDGNFPDRSKEESNLSSDNSTEISYDFDYAESQSTYPQCSSSQSDSSSIISVESSDNKSDTSEYSDPLHALEVLSENESESDLEELLYSFEDNCSDTTQLQEEAFKAAEIDDLSHDNLYNLCDSNKEFINPEDNAQMTMSPEDSSKTSGRVRGIL